MGIFPRDGARGAIPCLHPTPLTSLNVTTQELDTRDVVKGVFRHLFLEPKTEIRKMEGQRDDVPFSDYIMNVPLPQGFKHPTDMESYNRTTDP